MVVSIRTLWSPVADDFVYTCERFVYTAVRRIEPILDSIIISNVLNVGYPGKALLVVFSSVV